MATLSGKVFDDVSRTGTWTSGDTLRAGITISITDNATGAAVTTATTATDGTWSASVASGTVRVDAVPPVGMAALCPTGTLHYVVVAGTGNVANLDFGLQSVKMQVDYVRLWDKRPGT